MRWNLLYETHWEIEWTIIERLPFERGMGRLEAGMKKYCCCWGPATRDGRALCSELRGVTFWWRENTYSGFLEGTCSTYLWDINTCSTLVVEIDMSKGREGSN